MVRAVFIRKLPEHEYMKTRIRIIASGIVQGVFFRSSVREKAFDLNVNGWVKNRPDGKVEAVFEGEKFAVMEVVGFCRKGPPGARVDGMEIIKEDYENEFSSFDIRY